MAILFTAVSVAGSSSLPCPPGFALQGNNCNCANWTNGMVVCEDQRAFMQIGYCMTYDNTTDETIAGSCIHSFFSDNSSKFFYPLPPDVSDLNDWVCGPYNRKGVLCGKCREGFAVSPLSIFKCTNCTDTSSHNVIKFLALTSLLITPIFMVISIFFISVVSGPINSFIFFGQITASTFFNMGYIESVLEAQGSGFHYKNRLSTTLLAAIYDILNLNIFVAFIPPFCLTSKLSSLQALTLQYVSAFYPLILIILLYICIKLHDNDFKPIVYCWKPFRNCFQRLRRSVDAKTSVLDTFATFILLSYVKLLFIAGSILWPIPAYNQTGEKLHTLYVYSAGVKYFDHTKHLPYSVPSIFVSLVFIAVPPIVLFFYPISLFQKCLTKCKVNYQALRTFVEIFQGCYKDGTNGTRDWRYFAGLYFILRIIATVLAFNTSQTHVIGSAFLYWFTALLFVVVRPYKRHVYNVIDATIFSIMGSIYLLLTTNIVQVMLTGRPSYRLLALTDVLYSLPLLYLVLFSVCWVLDRKTDCIQKLTSYQGFFRDREIMQSEDFSTAAPHRLLNPGPTNWQW